METESEKILRMWVQFYRDQLNELTTGYNELKQKVDSLEQDKIIKIIKKISKKISENELGEIYLPNEKKYHQDFKLVFDYINKNKSESLLNDFPEFKCLMNNIFD